MSQDRRLISGPKQTAQLSITNTLVDLTDSASATVGQASELRGFDLYNPNNFPVWFKVFEGLASSLTLSSQAPTEVYELAPNAVTHRPADQPIIIYTNMSYAVTAEPGAGATTPGTAVAGKLTYGTN